MSLGGLLVGLFIVALGAILVGRRIVPGARAADPALAAPVTPTSPSSRPWWCAPSVSARSSPSTGGLLFYVSDAVLGWTRFVTDFPAGRVVVMSTYHLVQIGLVLALI